MESANNKRITTIPISNSSSNLIILPLQVSPELAISVSKSLQTLRLVSLILSACLLSKMAKFSHFNKITFKIMAKHPIPLNKGSLVKVAN
jgi:hypothetical protein